MTELVWTKSRILPPKGLLLALAAQFALLLCRLPLHLSSLEMAAGATLLAAGVLLNVWAERLFRRNHVGVCPFTDVPVLFDRRRALSNYTKPHVYRPRLPEPGRV